MKAKITKPRLPEQLWLLLFMAAGLAGVAPLSIVAGLPHSAGVELPSVAAPQLADSLWSIRIAESDSLYIGRPSGLYVSPSTGQFYVADGFAGRIVRLGRDGSPLSTIGRKGNGPGEFVMPRPLLVTDTSMLVADNQQGRLQLVHPERGVYISTHLYSGVLYSAAQGAGEVWLGLNDPSLRRSVTTFSPTTQVLSGTRLPWPNTYSESVRLAGMFDAVHVEAWADTVLVSYQGSDELVLLAAGGAVIDEITLPAVRRRGASEQLVSQLDDISIPEVLATVSAGFGLHRLPGGEIAVVHLDQQPLDGFVEVRTDLFLSLLGAERSRACLDEPIISGEGSQPQMAFRGDSLFVLSQEVTGAEAATWITAYRIRPDSCEWSPLG